MKWKHYSLFLSRPQVINTIEHWDAVRLNEQEPEYFIPDTLSQYTQLPSIERSKALASWIANAVVQSGCNHIYSIGCGVAYVEYNIKQLAGLQVTVTDFVPAVSRLEKLQVFDEVVQLDIVKDLPDIPKNAVVYLGRLDTELSDQQLNALFATLHRLGVKKVCMVPAQLLTPKVLMVEAYTWFKSLIYRHPRTFCGYSRSLNLFKKLASPYYSMQHHHVNGMPVFWLEERRYNA